jgi:hypothetical protein
MHKLWSWVDVVVDLDGESILVPALVVGYECHCRLTDPLYTVRLRSERRETSVAFESIVARPEGGCLSTDILASRGEL